MKHKINKPFCKAFGEHVRSLRKKKKFGLREFANLADMEFGQLYKIEKGITNPTISTIYHLAEALDVSHTDIFDFKFPVKNKKDK